MLKSYLLVFFISMVPIIELRGAIPIGLGMGLPVLPSYLVCVIGNMVPVPIIYFFARKVLEWGADKPVIGKFFTFCLVKGEHGGKKLQAKAGRGLFVCFWRESLWDWRVPAYSEPSDWQSARTGWRYGTNVGELYRLCQSV